MEDPTALSVFLSWVPMLLFIGVLILLVRAVRLGPGHRAGSKVSLMEEYSDHMKEHADQMKAFAEELRRLNGIADRIASNLENRGKNGA